MERAKYLALKRAGWRESEIQAEIAKGKSQSRQPKSLAEKPTAPEEAIVSLYLALIVIVAYPAGILFAIMLVFY